MKEIEIPNDSEQKGFELTIPDGMEAFIKDGKVIVREKESEDERIRTRLIALVEAFGQGEYKDEMLVYLEKQKEQKPAEWSEEDEEMIARICANLEYLVKEAGSDSECKEKLEERIKWMKRLKSLCPRPKAEWGEEDKKMLETIDKTLFKASVNAGLGTIRCPYDDARDWLKSLRPRSHWKPSEDEITAIEVALKFLLAHTSDEKLRVNVTSVLEHLKLL